MLYYTFTCISFIINKVYFYLINYSFLIPAVNFCRFIILVNINLRKTNLSKTQTNHLSLFFKLLNFSSKPFITLLIPIIYFIIWYILVFITLISVNLKCSEYFYSIIRIYQVIFCSFSVIGLYIFFLYDFIINIKK